MSSNYYINDCYTKDLHAWLKKNTRIFSMGNQIPVLYLNVYGYTAHTEGMSSVLNYHTMLVNIWDPQVYSKYSLYIFSILHQVDFLNSVIVDMQHKNEALTQQLADLESGHTLNGDTMISLNGYVQDDIIKTLRLRQYCHHFTVNIFKFIFLKENVWILPKISLEFVPNHIPTLVQLMAWRRPGDKPLSGSMMISLLMHICITRPQWIKWKLFLQFWTFVWGIPWLPVDSLHCWLVMQAFDDFFDVMSC